MPQTAQTNNAHFVARLHIIVTQRRQDGDACTQQRRNGSEIQILRNRNYKTLIGDHMLSVTAESGATGVFVGTVVGRGKASLAVLLFMLLSKVAVAAGIHHDTNAHNIARFESSYVRARLLNTTHNFMARHQRIAADARLVARHMEIGMAYATIHHGDFDVVRLQVAQFDLACCQRLRRLLSDQCINFNRVLRMSALRSKESGPL